MSKILLKLWNRETLSQEEEALEITVTEVAATWSVVNRTDISPDRVRELRRLERIIPSQEWGKGSAYRCLYRIGEMRNIQVGHKPGRPRKNDVSSAE